MERNLKKPQAFSEVTLPYESYGCKGPSNDDTVLVAKNISQMKKTHLLQVMKKKIFQIHFEGSQTWFFSYVIWKGVPNFWALKQDAEKFMNCSSRMTLIFSRVYSLVGMYVKQLIIEWRVEILVVFCGMCYSPSC